MTALSRLQTSHERLALELLAVDLAEARRRVQAIVLTCYDAQPEDVRSEISIPREEIGRTAQLPHESEVDALDSGYFDAEEAGDDVRADRLFRAARLVAAARFLAMGDSAETLCEAAYEALSSMPA